MPKMTKRSEDNAGDEAAESLLAQLATDLENCARELEALSARLTNLPADAVKLVTKDIVFPPSWGISARSIAGHDEGDERGRDQSLN
jgi:hypothetical protein